MDIIIDEDTFVRGSGGNVTGVIYFSGNKFDFPEYNWSDFPIIIGFNWLNDYMNFSNSKFDTFEFCFMDGPYDVIGATVDDNTYKLQFIRRYIDTSDLIYEEPVDKLSFEKILLKLCRKLLRICTKMDYSNHCISTIRNYMNLLKQSLQSKK